MASLCISCEFKTQVVLEIVWMGMEVKLLYAYTQVLLSKY